MNLDGDPRETFREEAHDLLADLEQALLGLESAPGNRDLIDRAFRDLHTLKGSGNMFGFQELGDFAHAVENVFVLVRDGKQKVTSGLVSASLRARDHIMRLLEETPLTDAEKNLIKVFDLGMAHYFDMAWDLAIARFEEALKMERVPDGKTTPSRVYIDRCRAFKGNPPVAPGEEWDCVCRLTKK